MNYESHLNITKDPPPTPPLNVWIINSFKNCVRVSLMNEDVTLVIVVQQQQSNYQLAATSNVPLVALPELLSFIRYNKTTHISPRRF